MRPLSGGVGDSGARGVRWPCGYYRVKHRSLLCGAHRNTPLGKHASSEAADRSSPGDLSTHRPDHLLRELGLALLVVLLVTTGKLWFEQTPDGEALQYLSYDRQQRFSAQRPIRGGELPVVVVDIAEFGLIPSVVEGRSLLVTPREPLRKLLHQLADANPLAIGVDVDFSPDHGAYVTAEDPQFFHECRELRDGNGKRLPVFLGVRRGQSLPRVEWLGSPDWAGFAAHMVAPREDHRKLAVWMRSTGEAQICGLAARLAAVRGAPGTAGCGPEELLYAAGGTGPHAPPEAGHHERWPHWFAELVVERTVGDGVDAGEYLVDYGPLRQLLETRIQVEPTGKLPVGLDTARLRGKLVLVGYATPDRTTDMTRLPGRMDEVPGIFAHACGVYTLVAHPLYELQHGVRLGLDLLLAAVLIGVVFGVRVYLERVGAGPAAANRVELLTILVLMAGVWIGGSQLPMRLGLIWSDYVLVVLALLLHPYAGTVLETVVERVPPVGRLAGRLRHAQDRAGTRRKPRGVSATIPARESEVALEPLNAKVPHENAPALDVSAPDLPAAGDPAAHGSG